MEPITDDKIGGFSHSTWVLLAIKKIGFYTTTTTFSYEDMEDIASISMFLYYERHTKYGRARIDWCLVDAIRQYCGRKGHKIHKSIAVSNIRTPDDKEYIIDDSHAIYSKYDDIELSEYIDSVAEKFSDSTTGKILKSVVFDNSTYLDAAKTHDAGNHVHHRFTVLRKNVRTYNVKNPFS